MAKYRFDHVARAERYFVDTLFAHLLIANNFEFFQVFFNHIFSSNSCKGLQHDFEIVSELDPIRDGSVYNNKVKAIYKDLGRIAVPDLFLRWDYLCILLEAKFFTDPSDEDLVDQVEEQRKAFHKVTEFTDYDDKKLKSAVLVVSKPKIDIPEYITLLTWEQILKLADRLKNINGDFKYCREILSSALERAKQESKRSEGITFKKYKYRDLIDSLPTLIEKGKVFIGFSGGVEKLQKATLEELIKRSHYKVSDVQWSESWIRIDQFLQRLLEVKGLSHRT